MQIPSQEPVLSAVSESPPQQPPSARPSVVANPMNRLDGSDQSKAQDDPVSSATTTSSSSSRELPVDIPAPSSAAVQISPQDDTHANQEEPSLQSTPPPTTNDTTKPVLETKSEEPPPVQVQRPRQVCLCCQPHEYFKNLSQD